MTTTKAKLTPEQVINFDVPSLRSQHPENVGRILWMDQREFSDIWNAWPETAYGK